MISIASWSPRKSEPLTVSNACDSHESSGLSAALMPPAAALECERTGWTLLRMATVAPSPAAARAARWPVSPAPMMRTSCAGMARTLVSGPRGGSAALGARIGGVDAVEPRLALAGAELLVLLRDWPAWTHRRVEHVTFLEEDFVRRRVSLDLTVLARAPRGWEGVGGAGARLVPLGLLRKGRLPQVGPHRGGGEAGAPLARAPKRPPAARGLAAPGHA